MELMAGYKQTEVGVIPDDWKAPKIGECLKICHGKNQKEVESINGEYPILGTGGEIGKAKTPLYSKPSVLIGRKGTIDAPRYIETPFWTVDTLFYSEVFSNSLPKYLFYQFCMVDWYSYNEASGVPSLNARTIEKIAIPKPPTMAEQEAIAEALSDADALIESLEKLVEKNRQIKQGTMQELLTGKKRLTEFSEEWLEKPLGEISTINKGSQLDNSKTIVHGNFPYLNGGITPSGFADKSNTPRNTIAISEGGNSCGYVQFMSESFWCGGHCYSVTAERLDNHFLYHALKSAESLIMGLRVGSGLPNVQKKALLRFKLRFPRVREEQAAIATILSDMDAELTTLEKKLTKAHHIKQGMMQELLTGRIRLV